MLSPPSPDSFEPTDLSRLVTAVAQGDRDAFAALFNHFYPRVVSYLAKGGLPAEAAGDVAQEAMLLIWQKAESFRPERGAVSTWVFAIARNLRIDSHRRAKVRGVSVNLDDYELASVGPLPEERLMESQQVRRIRDALRHLPSDQLCALQMSFFSEQPYIEVARALDVPLSTVKARIRRALLNLRERLETLEP